MRGSIALLALAATVTMASNAGAHDLLEAIDAAHRLGQLDEGGRLHNRVAAIVDPSQLDERFRPLSRERAPSSRCHAETMVEAFQRLHELPSHQRAPIRELLDPPSDLAYFVESDGPFPVRVSYGDPSLQEKAERILAAVAISYQREVVDMGFWPPLIEPGTEPYRFYLMNAGGAAGYTSPYLENASTPHADAYSYIVIDPVLDDIQLDATVAHEFNHACQVAMDVAEVRSFMENTASYIEIPVFPAGLPFAAAVFPYFQSQPYRPLEYRVTAQSDGYEYGGALWPLFLVNEYADGDPVWLRRVWEGAVQEGGLNEPDYFDAINALLAEEGGVPAAALEFARQRFFVGSRADGQHLPGAEHWGGAEVWLTAQWSHPQLPILDQEPNPETRPQPNGCNYIMFTPDASSDVSVKFSFAGDTLFDWDVSLLSLVDGAETQQAALPLDESTGEISLPQHGIDEILMLVCQATDTSYDPDDKAWIGADYAYSIQLDIPPPQIDGVSPGEIAAGSVKVPVTITGTGFVLGEGFAVALSGEQVAVEGAQVLSPEELRVFVTVAPGAAIGARDVMVTNPGGAASTAAGAIDIILADADAPSRAASEGCGCRAAPSSSHAPWWLVGALGLWWRRRQGGLMVAALLAVLCSASEASADEYVDSASYPLRVYYKASVDPATAQQALAFAENAWQVQVEQMGFGPVYTVDESDNIIEGLNIHLDPDAAYNHAEAIGDNPNTPHTDCTVKAVVATMSPVSFFEIVVAHEMSHALEMAADCGESPFAWENTTMAVMVLMFGQDPLFDEFVRTFQQNPHDGVDCFFFADEKKRYYHYGAALFQLFLEDRYGAYDGKLLSAFWNAAKQNGSVLSVGPSGNQLDVENDPNLMDAIDAVLPVSFDEAFAEFGRWRYFVGSRDDGAHFTQGASWVGAEVRVDTALGLDALPLTGGVPGTPVSEYGSAYIVLDLDGIEADTGLDLRFDGDPAMRWSVDALLVRSDNTAEVRTLELDDAVGQLLVEEDLSAFDHVALVISNLSDGDHNPDAPSCGIGASFSYSLSLADLALAPTVDGVDPSSLSPGATHEIWLSGSDFAEGMQIAISGDGIEVGVPSFVDAATVGVEVTVAADAEPGPRDLTVTNPNGMASTRDGAITITGDQASSGCGCELAGPLPTRPWAVWLVGLAVLAGRWRRRR